MAMTTPDEINLTLYRIVTGDDREFITKFTNTQSALETFSAQLNPMVASIAQALDDALQAAEETRQQAITDTTAIKNTAVSAAATATTKAGESANSAAEALQYRNEAMQAVSDGYIVDEQMGLVTTWSSEKISAEIKARGTKGTLTQSFFEGQQERVVLTTPLTDSAVVSVIKEVPQTSVTSNQWNLNANGTGYDVENTAYATSLTPDDVSGFAKLVLDSGSFASTDVGKVIYGNGGEAVLILSSGECFIRKEFNDVSPIPSGAWKMEGLKFSDNSYEVSNIALGFGDVNEASYVTQRSTAVGTNQGMCFSSDGLNLFVVNNSNVINQFNLSEPFNISTLSSLISTYSVSSQTSAADSLDFNNNGTKMYVAGGGFIFQYTLITGFNLNTVSYDNISFDCPQTSDIKVVRFNKSGTKMFLLSDIAGGDVYQYTLTTGFDLSTASYDNVFLDLNDRGMSSPCYMAFGLNGRKLYTGGLNGKVVYQYTLTIGFDLSTASYDNVSLNIGLTSNPVGIWLSADGEKLFVTSYGNVFEYLMSETYYAITDQHLPAITKAGGQIDSTFWTDINSSFATDTPNSQTINYAFSTDGRMTFKVVKASEGARNIARDNAGAWEINTNATYAGETWAVATKQDVWGALSEAMDITANTMPSALLSAATDADFPALGNELDLAIILYTNNATQIPISQGVTLNYDANVLNQGAINGTDYEWDQPDNSTVRIKALKANNLKVRVV